MLFLTNDGHWKRKTSPTAIPFWPQRDLSYGVTTGSLAAGRPKDIADSFSHALATWRDKWRQWPLSPFQVIFFFCVFFIFLSLLILRPSTQDGLRMPSEVYSGVLPRYPRPYWQIEVFRRNSRITVNTVTLNALHKVNILWPKHFFPETWCVSLQCLIHHCDCFQKRWTFEK